MFLHNEPVRILGKFETGPAEYRVPTLPAYAIEYAELRVHSGIDGVGETDLILDRDVEIRGDIVNKNIGQERSLVDAELPDICS